MGKIEPVKRTLPSRPQVEFEERRPACAAAAKAPSVIAARRCATREPPRSGAGHDVEVQALEAQREALETEVADLTTRTDEEAVRLEGLRTETHTLQQGGGLALVRALQAFLPGRTAKSSSGSPGE